MNEIRSIDTLFGGYTPPQNKEGIATLYSCVRLITNTIAATPLIHINKDKENQAKSRLSNIFKSPERDKTLFTWLNSMVRDLVLNGNAYALIVDDELIYIPSSQVSVYLTHQAEAPYYYQISAFGKSLKVFPEDIIHLKNITLDGYVGISPLQQHQATLDASISLQTYAANFTENSTALSGIIESDKKLDREAIADIQSSFSQNYGGLKNAGKTAVMPQGFTFKPIQMASSTDIDFINNYKLNKSLIAEIFQVPLSMLGTSDLSYNNAESNALAFQNFTIKPILRNIEQELTLKLTDPRQEDKIIFLVDTLELASSKEKADSLSLLVNTQIFTPNEARKKYGLTSIKGGDEFAQKTLEKQAPKEITSKGTNSPPSEVKPPSKRSKNA